MIEQLSLDIFYFFKALGLSGAFLSMMVENIGIPLPTEIGYLIAQDAIERSTHSYLFILFVLTLGHLVGALISYGLGRWGGIAITTRLKRNKKIAEVHDKLEEWYQKYGSLTIFITRFVGYVRPWSSIVAGFAGVKFWPFLIWTTIGSIIFNVFGLYFSSIFILIWRRYEVYHFVFIVFLTVMFFGVFFYEIIKYLVRRTGSKRQ